jgi:IMP dehydrogenase
MIGSLFAGTEEAPGEVIFSKDATSKLTRNGFNRRDEKRLIRQYAQEGTVSDSKYVPEGIEGRVAYKERWRKW